MRESRAAVVDDFDELNELHVFFINVALSRLIRHLKR
jgi:hypothetical protein